MKAVTPAVGLQDWGRGGQGKQDGGEDAETTTYIWAPGAGAQGEAQERPTGLRLDTPREVPSIPSPSPERWEDKRWGLERRRRGLGACRTAVAGGSAPLQGRGRPF